MADATTESDSPTRNLPPRRSAERRPLLRRLAFVAGMLGFAAVFVALRPHLPLKPFPRSLVGASVLAVGGVAAFFLFGKEPQRRLQVCRIFFSTWALLLAPLLINIAFGLSEEGWPSGRHNRPVARLLIWIFITTIPALLTGLAALIRCYRLTAGLALFSALASLGCSYFLFVETAPIRFSAMLPLRNALHILGFFSKVVAFAAVPVGIAFAVAGVMILRVPRDQMRAPTPQDRPA